MKLYLAGERLGTEQGLREGRDFAGVWIKHVKRRLFSFYYHGFSGHRSTLTKDGLSLEIKDGIDRGLDLFLDSGAFTAFTKSMSIPLEEYANYVKRTDKAWTTCSSVDFIGSGEEAAAKSFANFTWLRDNGARVQPVWHVREPMHWLQRYVDEGWDYIFIGGMVPETTRWLKVRLDEAWAKVLTNEDGTPRVKCHGFGLTDQELMFRYPWFSVDSSSWLMTGIFGACLFRVDNRLRKVVFSEESPETRKFKGWHYKNLPRESRDMVDSWVAPYGVTAEQLGQHYSYRDVVNAAVFQGLEDMGAKTFHMEQEVLFQ